MLESCPFSQECFLDDSDPEGTWCPTNSLGPRSCSGCPPSPGCPSAPTPHTPHASLCPPCVPCSPFTAPSHSFPPGHSPPTLSPSAVPAWCVVCPHTRPCPHPGPTQPPAPAQVGRLGGGTTPGHQGHRLHTPRKPQCPRVFTSFHPVVPARGGCTPPFLRRKQRLLGQEKGDPACEAVQASPLSSFPLHDVSPSSHQSGHRGPGPCLALLGPVLGMEPLPTGR